MGKEKTINQRIKEVMNTLGYDEAQFARKIGVSSGALVNVINKNDDPSYAMLVNITTVLPVHQKWLMLGEGPTWTQSNISKWTSKTKSDQHQVDKEVNSRFKQIRMHLGLSQTIMAAEIGVTRDVVSNIETNRTSPTIHAVKVLKKKYGVNMLWLIEGEKPMMLKEKS